MHKFRKPNQFQLVQSADCPAASRHAEIPTRGDAIRSCCGAQVGDAAFQECPRSIDLGEPALAQEGFLVAFTGVPAVRRPRRFEQRIQGIANLTAAMLAVRRQDDQTTRPRSQPGGQEDNSVDRR